MNKNYSILFLFLLFIQVAILSATYSDFDRYQNKFTKDEILTKIKHYLKKDDEISNYFVVTDNVFYLYSSPEDKIANLPEYTLQLATEVQAKPSNPQQTLKGMRIAIDPGHFGGDLALMEQRWIYMTPNTFSLFREEISFNEGTLTLLTAKVLRDLLEKEGAVVLLTKEKNGSGVYEKDFSSWFATFENTNQLSQSESFRLYFNPLDLRARAKKINDFTPDLTVIIHYNAHNDRNFITGENIPSTMNYNMVFVPGSFCKNELKHAVDRYEFMRLLLTQDLEKSVQLSRAILKRFTKTLNVPPVDDSLDIKYLKNVSIKVGKGVYARNLTLTRLVHGPLCYGETLCQDNVSECVLLNEKNLVMDNIKGPKRAEQVAQAYYDGIVNYINSQ